MSDIATAALSASVSIRNDARGWAAFGVWMHRLRLTHVRDDMLDHASALEMEADALLREGLRELRKGRAA